MNEIKSTNIEETLAELGINKLKAPDLKTICEQYAALGEEHLGLEALELLAAAKSNIDRTHAITAAAKATELVPGVVDEDLAKAHDAKVGDWALFSVAEDPEDIETNQPEAEDLHTRAEAAIKAGKLRFENRLIINIRPRVMHGIKKYELDGADGASYLATKEELEELV